MTSPIKSFMVRRQMEIPQWVVNESDTRRKIYSDALIFTKDHMGLTRCIYKYFFICLISLYNKLLDKIKWIIYVCTVRKITLVIFRNFR